MPALVEVGNHVQHNLRPLTLKLSAVINEALEGRVDVTDRGGQVGLADAAVKDRHVMSVLDKRPDHVAADKTRPAEHYDAHRRIIGFGRSAFRSKDACLGQGVGMSPEPKGFATSDLIPNDLARAVYREVATRACRQRARPPLGSVRMPRFRIPAAGDLPPATGTLALAVAVLGLVAAGCSNSSGHRAATATASAPRSSAPCKLNRTQRRGVARALADIRRLRRIQAPMQTFSQHGAPTQNMVTGRFLLDVGSAHLPLNVYAELLHLAKAAVRLCGDCSQGLEAAEPVLGTRAHKRCG